MSTAWNSVGVLGTTVPFVLDSDAPERKSTADYGKALFKSQSFDEWSDTYASNTSSIFFVTTAFLGLLEAGACDPKTVGETASVINITSAVSSFNNALYYV